MIDRNGRKASWTVGFVRAFACIYFSSCCIFSGCAPAHFIHPDIDLVGSTQWTGSILFECNGPKQPSNIVGSYITIDGQKRIFVDSFSRQQVIVATGTHTLSIVTVASDEVISRRAGEEPPLDKIHEFGKTSTATLYMIDGGAVIVRYTPPASLDEAGQLSLL